MPFRAALARRSEARQFPCTVPLLACSLGSSRGSQLSTSSHLSEADGVVLQFDEHVRKLIGRHLEAAFPDVEHVKASVARNAVELALGPLLDAVPEDAQLEAVVAR